MNDAEILPAPEIEVFPSAPTTWTKWQRERETFWRLLPALLSTHRGQYVAIHEGQVVDSGDDEVALALRAYKKYGYVELYVGLVSDEPPPRVLRLPAPRLLHAESSPS